MGAENFRRTLRFAKNIVSIFNISRQHTNVAAGVYARNCITSFKFQEHFNQNTVATAIDNTPFLDELPINISHALHIVKEEVFTTDRDNVPDVLVVFVSASLSGDFSAILQHLLDKGITIIAVGIGNGYVTEQLQELGSKPGSDHVITVSFQDMDIRAGAVCGATSQGNYNGFCHG